MKRYFFLAIAVAVALSCRAFSPGVPSTVAPTEPQGRAPIEPPASTDTPAPSNTPAPTAGPSLTPTAEPLSIPTVGILPQQWNGIYTYPTGEKQHLSLLIEKVDGATFKGKVIWQSFGSSKGAILKMNGEYVTDFGDRIEQAKWKNLEDYNTAHRAGTWLKWTETEMISGAYYTVNGWYYAHIREDGTMAAVYFFNKDETTADVGSFLFQLATR